MLGSCLSKWDLWGMPVESSILSGEPQITYPSNLLHPWDLLIPQRQIPEDFWQSILFLRARGNWKPFLTLLSQCQFPGYQNIPWFLFHWSPNGTSRHTQLQRSGHSSRCREAGTHPCSTTFLAALLTFYLLSQESMLDFVKHLLVSWIFFNLFKWSTVLNEQILSKSCISWNKSTCSLHTILLIYFISYISI